MPVEGGAGGALLGGRPERRALRKRDIDSTRDQQDRADRDAGDHKLTSLCAQSPGAGHEHFTRIRLANCAPRSSEGSSFASGAIWNSFAAVAGSISSGRTTTILHPAGDPTSATALSFSKEKSTKYDGS